jgi:hypothetical protein
LTCTTIFSRVVRKYDYIKKKKKKEELRITMHSQHHATSPPDRAVLAATPTPPVDRFKAVWLPRLIPELE